MSVPSDARSFVKPETPSWPTHRTESVLVHGMRVQVSPVVQAFRSSRAAPAVFGGLVHVPVWGSQTPTSWHESSAVQMTPVQLVMVVVEVVVGSEVLVDVVVEEDILPVVVVV